MPTYEYQCNACGHRFERRQGFNEEPVKVCPECSGATRRVLHPVGIIFKGSGWYVTDNRSDSRIGVSGESNGTAKSDEPKNGKAESAAKPEKAESKAASGESASKS